MTRGSVAEYVEAVRSRYRGAGRKEKGDILDEFVRVTGYHRKAAIRMLLRGVRGSGGGRGRPSRYRAVLEPLRAIWEASDRLCSRRLEPFVPEMVKVLRRHGEQRINAREEELLCQMSAATMDRLLRPYRKQGGRRSLSTTRPGNLLKSMIPIRTFAEWEDKRAGFLEVDLVAHCGESAEGFYLTTLSAVDVATGWYEPVVVWGKGQDRVGGAVNRVRERLPFSMLGLDSDNGSEFINHSLYDYCRRHEITFTRSRSYKKNDSCHVEQKNGNIVRRLVGYDRYSSKAAYECLGRVYDNVRLYMNFFQPTMKLWSKSRDGARVYKVYEKAQTPYQRLLRSGALEKSKRADLSATYSMLNPVILLKHINENLEQLWRMADRHAGYGNRTYEATIKASVTV